MKKLWGIIVMIIIGGAVIMEFLNNAGATANANAASSAEAELSRVQAELSRVQFEKILAAGEMTTQGEIWATVKWQGEWHTELSLDEAQRTLAEGLGWSDSYVEEGHERKVFYVEGDAGELEGKLTIMHQEEGQYYVVLRLENQTMMGLGQLAEYGEEYGRMLLAEGVDAKWNAALQGASVDVTDALALPRSGAAMINGQELGRQGVPVTAAFEAIESRAGERLKLRQVESFEDERTISRSYTVEELPIKVQSAGQNINLQLALHWNTEMERYDLSIGTPLLTVEY
ncbi:YwmB family TATA-box binding protein [Paenibacillus lentus]|uniref:TATA-box binding protein n=1 Tax=Paenibacillus lentus TaxID=1338368 RepID=A0A3S8RTB9_9BACL|nr:YwmB family TATA-box binding protein [Paenibacillus lentus]AZK46209.1 hypothetical protein EIM92_08490 [Paenibacillus lentus]